MKTVTYGGSKNRSPLITHETYEVEVGGEVVAFEEGVPKDVSDDVVKALGKHEGHNFEIAAKGEAPARAADAPAGAEGSNR